MSPAGRTLTSASSSRLTFHVTFLTGDIRQIAEVNMTRVVNTQSGGGWRSEQTAAYLLCQRTNSFSRLNCVCVCNVCPKTKRQKQR